MAIAAYLAHLLYCGPYYPQHTAVGVDAGQVVLLYGAKSLGRCGVACHNHQPASLPEQVFHSLQGEVVHQLKRAAAIGCAGIVAQIQIVVLRQQRFDVAQHSQTSVTRVEYTYRRHIFVVRVH